MKLARFELADEPIDTVQLITYADRLGGTLSGLEDLLSGSLDGVFGGVHVLPFYRPFDGADAGFDPQDHSEVDPRLGTWNDVKSLSRARTVMADVIVNHISTNSEQFQETLLRGDESPWSDMFLTMSTVFPGGASEADLARIYRPRPGLPFTTMTVGGRRRLMWTTFTNTQVDLDIRHSGTWGYLTTIIDRLTAAGVTMLRLDAVGYAGKAAGTNCFLTPESRELVERISTYAYERGARVLVEVHGHHRQQVEIARDVDYVYDFALPPLVLHALTAGDLTPLGRWLDIRPANSVTVLDTHDGIGIVDVGASELRPDEPGLLTEEQMHALVEAIHDNSGGTSRLATGAAASNLDIYQVNCTFYDALGADDQRYLLARLVQLFVPGIPQIYYVGMLAGRNDLELLGRTGVGRDVNRHYYDAAEIQTELHRPVVRRQLEAIRFRNRHPAFGGTFSHRIEGTTLELERRNGDHRARVIVDIATSRYTIVITSSDRVTTITDLLELAGVPAAAGQAR